MKNSNFNSNFFYNGHQIWYNSLSNEFLVLNNFLNELFVASLNENNVDDLKNLHPDFYSELYNKNFIVENDIDEIEQIRKMNQRLINNETKYELTINPTMNCNFKCWYCYESHIKDSILKSDKPLLDRVHTF